IGYQPQQRPAVGADLVIELLLLRQQVHRRLRAAAVLDRRQRVALELIDADRGREELQRLERDAERAQMLDRVCEQDAARAMRDDVEFPCLALVSTRLVQRSQG